MIKTYQNGGERMNIAAAFAAARENAGYSQHEVARRLGINQATVSYWESGKTTPRGALLVKVADLYCCSIDRLMGRDCA